MLLQQGGRPGQAAFGQECCGEIAAFRIGEQPVDQPLDLRIGRADQRQRDRAQPQLEQPVAARGLQIIMPLRAGPADQLDLAAVEPEALIARPALGLDGPVIGQQDALRAALDDRRGDGALGDIGQALRGEDHRDILLAQHLEPFADARGKERMVEEDPGFIENEQGRPTGEAGFEPVEEIGQHRRDHPRLPHQRLGLETLQIGEGKIVARRVEQGAERPIERVGRERRPQHGRLEQHGEPRHGALGGRGAGETGQRRPHHLLDLGRDQHLFMGEQRADPFGGPSPLIRRVIWRRGWNAMVPSSPPPSPRA
jgi:hypothetical protein